MCSIRTVTISSIILLGLFNGCCGQICNITTPFNNRGVIQQKVTLGCCPGYVVVRHPRLKQTYCKAKCDKQCQNGRCTGPNTCTCKQGYEFASEYTKTVCVPKCDSCVNGNCVLPNVCQCRLKFHKNEDGVCVPNCDTECIHGTCSAPNVCQCDLGYRLNSSFANICDPVCDPPCSNGYCSGVNKCTCWEGFSPSNVDPWGCVKEEEDEPAQTTIVGETEIKCLNGTLNDNNECNCPEDHQRIPLENGEKDGFQCLEHKSCNGKCLDLECPLKEQCKCESGYDKISQNNETFKCLPLCEKDCQNASCKSPNTCECFEGFEKTSTNADQSHICRPVCKENCTNGFCSAPNQCSCYDGFEPLKLGGSGGCRPKCDNCTEKEDCIAPGKCECKASYRITENGDCGDIILCNLGVVHERKCLCLNGYFLDGDTCRPEAEKTEKPTTIKEDLLKLITTTEIIIQTTIPEDDEAEEVLSNDLQSPIKYIPVEEFPTITESDMEILPTTSEPFCKNGKTVNGKCVCPKEYFNFWDQECVLKSSITNEANGMVPKCSEGCLSGNCFKNGTCKCGPQYKLAPDDPQKCIPMAFCELCLINDSFPCPTHCFSTEYSPSRQSSIPQYLIIVLACLITLALVILGFSFYKRMQKHDYYTGRVDNTAPIYAYELETLT